MGEKIGKISNITKAALDSRYEDTRKVLDGSLFSESDKGLIKFLKNSLEDQKQREILLDILESRSKEPVPLSEIIKVFDKFSDISKVELTPEDIKLVNFTIKYFENWFYSGEWAKVSQKQNKNPNAYAYFSVPAGLVNVITKLKDNRENPKEITSFDSQKLSLFVNEVKSFVNEFLSKERLESVLKEDLNPAKKEKVEFLYKNREAIFKEFLNSEKSVQDELRGIRGSGSQAPDLYLLKTILIGAEIIRREQEIDPKYYVFSPEKEMKKSEDNYVWFDFSRGKDRHSSMHYHQDRILFSKFVAEYLRSKK
ncbi:MAG: hypothetical protein QG583_401 [Patescibacteria group bacterium]|nr:hypothetical protein [Patescibacteria group bacterium]